ncbi:MAG: acyl-CoA dehydrogenase family protein [Pseudomonadales bacterium]|nr:acyl-CoA dehydrogenase family protein [Pseudomonadales bacterium]MBO6563352.1 acyl-CoA dehydrogenase family protein [Pseudomonadales bacterium]MBO6597853.1 acyl-CoA dehydrogenase family protein [Pseudomonadales bacterium]MBO6658722.1 acyl-CoA dehydrogenase family protein [Pseudomonadales bacterium]MBO6702325.1 acyl-CoA dehydrogenase family protein [Pseudomonadales bacterium]
MTQFQLNEDQALLLDHADKFGREQLLPLAERMDNEEWWPDDLMPKLGELGFLGVTVPEKYGGVGMGYVEAGVILQAFSRYNHAFGLSWVAHDNLCANNLYNNGNENIRERYLPKLCSGEWTGCLGLTEPGAGSDALGSMRTRAIKDGDNFIINGSKLYITNGPVADVCLLYAKTEPGQGSKGITAFAVETNSPGFKVAQKLKKMGFRGSQTAELVFEDLVVPRDNIVGEENQGHKVVMSGLDFERAMIAPINVGMAERALALSVDYAKTREQFGKTISEFQMIQSYLADMYTWIETMKTFSWQVLAESDNVEGHEAGRGEIHARTAASVMYCANMCNRVLDYAVQIHGGSGYIWESEVNRLFRGTKLLEIGAGTTEVRKMIIAGELLK